MDIDPGGAGPPRPLSADEFAQFVAQVRASFARIATFPSMQRDPYKLILLALSDSLDVHLKGAQRLDAAIAEMLAARDPIAPDRLKEMLETVAARAEAGAENGGYRGMRKEGARIIRTVDFALSVRIGLMIGAGFIAGALAFWVFTLFR